MSAAFEQWTQGRTVPTLGTNCGATELPFQHWRHFKEAFTPELIARAIKSSPIPVVSCLDPFGGSGTTALACQFLGVHPKTIEVNPFLGDLIEAKLTRYSADHLARDFRSILQAASGKLYSSETVFKAAPDSFVEPGVRERWIFDRTVAERIAAFVSAVEALPDERHRRLFRVLLGGILVQVSNVVVSGKGRRYRSGWERRRRSPDDVDRFFIQAAQRAIIEIHRFQARPVSSFELLRGDCREVLAGGVSTDLVVFSPPYPNSFDYTDVYNVELWALGYLSSKRENHELRNSTLCSHVQLAREYPSAPEGSGRLDKVIQELNEARPNLWNRSIPGMVAGYFADICTVMSHVHRSMALGGMAWIVVGDSRYANVQIDTAAIIAELASSIGWRLAFVEPFRSMRASPQQGGRPELAESLVVLQKTNT